MAFLTVYLLDPTSRFRRSVAMPARYASAHELAAAIDQDPNLKNQVAADPANQIRNLVDIPNTPIYRLLLVFLGLAVLIALSGILALAFYQKEIPQAAVAIASTAVGALAGILAPSPK
jgi:hypothetical protein